MQCLILYIFFNKTTENNFKAQKCRFNLGVCKQSIISALAANVLIVLHQFIYRFIYNLSVICMLYYIYFFYISIVATMSLMPIFFFETALIISSQLSHVNKLAVISKRKNEINQCLKKFPFLTSRDFRLKKKKKSTIMHFYLKYFLHA